MLRARFPGKGQWVLLSPLRRATVELLGTAALLALIVGSGIMAERLSGGNVALALLANALATGAGLIALILACQPLSGAHFNPVVTLAAVLRRDMRPGEGMAYAGAQLTGALLGVAAAHLMFGQPIFAWSTHARAGLSQHFSEFIATFGLLAVIFAVARTRAAAIAPAVGLYIMAAYWFTASTAFANPAVTLGRALTDTFTGIRPEDVPPFVLAQFAGGLAALGVSGWLFKAQSGHAR